MSGNEAKRREMLNTLKLLVSRVAAGDVEVLSISALGEGFDLVMCVQFDDVPLQKTLLNIEWLRNWVVNKNNSQGGNDAVHR